MVMAKKPQDGLNEPLEFAADTSSKRKKGAHRPEFADVFTQPGEPQQTFSKVHLLVNPFSGKKRGRRVRKTRRMLLCSRLAPSAALRGGVAEVAARGRGLGAAEGLSVTARVRAHRDGAGVPY